MADNPQLPDFAAIGDNHSRIAIAHEQLSREMQHMANLPPIEVNQMMQMLRNVAEGLVTLVREWKIDLPEWTFTSK